MQVQVIGEIVNGSRPVSRWSSIPCRTRLRSTAAASVFKKASETTTPSSARRSPFSTAATAAGQVTADYYIVNDDEHRKRRRCSLAFRPDDASERQGFALRPEPDHPRHRMHDHSELKLDIRGYNPDRQERRRRPADIRLGHSHGNDDTGDKRLDVHHLAERHALKFRADGHCDRSDARL